jgi:recombination protein RecT
MAFDTTREPSLPIPAATVVLVRERAGGGGVEVFFLRRHRRSSFMSDAFVFPGGKSEPEDASPEETAIRELFEEAGVLVTDAPVSEADRLAWRKRLAAGEATFAEMLEALGVRPALDRMHYWARWITPSVEPKRFDAQFFLAEAPAGQDPAFDATETVEQVWLTPAEALARHDAEAFKLPPPQVRTMNEMRAPADRGLAALVAAAAERRRHAQAVMPRFAELDETIALLLPWDPEYDTRGVGQGMALPRDHFLATSTGGTRFVLEGMTWRMR